MAEGVTPPSQKLTYEDISVVLQQWGTGVEITDVIVDNHEDDVLKGIHGPGRRVLW